jgi:hypothetical protein
MECCTPEQLNEFKEIIARLFPNMDDEICIMVMPSLLNSRWNQMYNDLVKKAAAPCYEICEDLGKMFDCVIKVLGGQWTDVVMLRSTIMRECNGSNWHEHAIEFLYKYTDILVEACRKNATKIRMLISLFNSMNFSGDKIIELLARPCRVYGRHTYLSLADSYNAETLIEILSSIDLSQSYDAFVEMLKCGKGEAVGFPLIDMIKKWSTNTARLLQFLLLIMKELKSHNANPSSAFTYFAEVLDGVQLEAQHVPVLRQMCDEMPNPETAKRRIYAHFKDKPKEIALLNLHWS